MTVSARSAGVAAGRFVASLVVCAAGILLAACATVAPPGAPADTLSGRLTVRVDASASNEARALSAAFELRGNAREGALDLNTPLGTTIARARWAPSGVALMTSDGEQRFADLDGLSRESLGEAVPLAALFDWLRGRPWAGAASTPATPPSAGFSQLGWTVDLARFDEGWIAATRARAPAVNLRARLDR